MDSGQSWDKLATPNQKIGEKATKSRRVESE
jgi:hypothetical protein